MRRMQIGVVMGAVLLAALGCSDSNKPVEVHPVSGQVMYGGKPAVGVKVYLMPTSAPMVPQIPANPSGITGPDGRFTITTYKDGDGAAEGGYQINLFWPTKSADGGREENETDKLLGWYDGVRSKLSIQVKPGKNEVPVISITPTSKPPEAVEGIPGKN